MLAAAPSTALGRRSASQEIGLRAALARSNYDEDRVPQPRAAERGAFDARMFPRSDGIALGGTFQHGNSNLEPNEATVRTIVTDHAAFFAAIRQERGAIPRGHNRAVDPALAARGPSLMHHGRNV